MESRLVLWRNSQYASQLKGGREGEMGRREDKSRLVDQEAGNGTHVYTCVGEKSAKVIYDSELHCCLCRIPTSLTCSTRNFWRRRVGRGRGGKEEMGRRQGGRGGGERVER